MSGRILAPMRGQKPLVERRRSPASQPAHERVDDHLHEPRRDGGIERGAAGLQDLDPEFGGGGLRCYDDPSHA